MIICCPTCNAETLLTKSQECESGWKCDKCKVCCITKSGIPFQSEPDTAINKEKWLEKEKYCKDNDLYEKEYKPAFIKKKTKKKQSKGRQMTIFDII